MKTWTKKFQKMLTLILAICLVTGCMGFSNVQAATGKSGTTYYNTCINGKKDWREDHFDSFTKQKKAGSTGRYFEKM